MDATRFSIPQLLLGGLVLALVLTIGVAGATSSTPLSLYNANWDGSSELRGTAVATDAETSIIIEQQQYATLSANESLAVILAPERGYSREERDRIRAYLESGGTLLVAGDFQPATNDLLAGLDSDTRVAGPPLRDEVHYYRAPSLPVATQVNASPYTTNVESVTLNRGTYLQSGEAATVIVRSSDLAYADLNEDGQLQDAETVRSYPVVANESVGAGELIVMSDPSIFLNAMLERAGNERFASALLAGFDHVAFDYTHSGGLPVLPYLVWVIRTSPVVQIGLGLGLLVAIGVAGTVRFDRFGQNPEPTADRLSKDELVAGLKARHPEWDEDWIEHVVERVREDDEG